MLETADLRESIDYYSGVLGFIGREMFPNEEYPHGTSLTKDKTVIVLSARDSQAKYEKPMKYEKPIMTGSLCFNPENVDQLWEGLKSKAAVSYEIQTFDYGMREFGILDPNGYLLQFGQDIANAEKYEDIRRKQGK